MTEPDLSEAELKRRLQRLSRDYEKVKARLAKAWARADVVVDSSCLCIRPGGGGHRP